MQQMNTTETTSAFASVFCPNKPLRSSEAWSEIGEMISRFLSTWNVHGVELKSSYKKFGEGDPIGFYIYTEEGVAPSGCSKDSLTHLIKDIENRFDINLTDRQLIIYQSDNEVVYTTFSDFKQKIIAKSISENTKVVNLWIDPTQPISVDSIPYVSVQNTWFSKFF